MSCYDLSNEQHIQTEADDIEVILDFAMTSGTIRTIIPLFDDFSSTTSLTTKITDGNSIVDEEWPDLDSK